MHLFPLKLFQIKHRNQNSPFVLCALLLLVWIGVFTADAPWQVRTGGLALVMGILAISSPGVVSLPKGLSIFAFLFLLLGWSVFLPAEWFGIPGWRNELRDAGVETGSQVAIQFRDAFESQLYLILIFLAGLWVISLRASSQVLRKGSLAFVLGVAAYALLSQILKGDLQSARGEFHFGFFPNRNHTTTYLAMGFVCSLGIAFQAIRSRHFLRLGIALILGALILWAVFSWSISRAGIVLCLAGGILWIVGLGHKYFGRQELKALGLVIILVAGVFALSESGVKERLASTVEQVTRSWDKNSDPLKAGSDEFMAVDLRIPIALDTFAMMADSPLTGVGAGQFRWVFPQYRHHTIGVEYAMAFHPESSWLWLATELGIPAAFFLLILVVCLYWRGVKNIRQSGARDRALRMGCLVGSILVPLHGLFDVPAHRPSLILAALLLYALSQNRPSEVDPELSPKWLWSTSIGALLIAAAAMVLLAPRFGWRAPMAVKAERDLANAVVLYKQVNTPQSDFDLFEGLKLREKIRSLADEAIRESPLNGRLYRLRGLVSLPILFASDTVSQNFEIDRKLTPYSVGIPMIQAFAALPYDQREEEVAKAWREAIRNSESADRVRSGSSGMVRLRTVQRIRFLVAKRAPHLKTISERIIAGD